MRFHDLIRASVWLGATLALATKIPESKVIPSVLPTTTNECAEGSGEASEPPLPVVFVNGSRLTELAVETVEVDGRMVHMRSIAEGAELQLTYVHSIIDDSELTSLVEMVERRDGWKRSPLKAQDDGKVLAGKDDQRDKDSRRTSSSCPMLWPLVYRHLRDGLIEKRPDVVSELDLVTNISERVAALFRATGMELTADHIEPLQMLKYQPGELFGPHHDYHLTGESSVQGEQRIFTMLIFGSTLSEEEGGETCFPHLGLSVSPRRGDSIVWMNVKPDGEVNERSLHEGRPPRAGREKLAMNVWIAEYAIYDSNPRPFCALFNPITAACPIAWQHPI